MFKGTYTDRLYRAIRDALHAEVESWKPGAKCKERTEESAELWRLVESLEPISRNLDPTELHEAPRRTRESHFLRDAHFIPLRAVIARSGEAND